LRQFEEKTLNHSKKIASLNQGLSCGLKNSQVKKVKASTLAQGDSPQHLRKERKDKQEKL